LTNREYHKCGGAVKNGYVFHDSFVTVFCLLASATAQQPLSSLLYTPSLDLGSLDRAAEPCQSCSLLCKTKIKLT